jgi:hypothetical protein
MTRPAPKSRPLFLRYILRMPSQRPAPDEYAPYYEKYIAKVRDGEILDILIEQADAIRGLFARVPPERGHFAYAPGKWTLSEAMQHVVDTERVFSYRALRIARGDTLNLPGFEQNDWVPVSGANARALAMIIEEFTAVRAATVALFRGLPAESWDRRGSASGYPVSVRALAFKCAGHALHHEGIVREKYLAD